MKVKEVVLAVILVFLIGVLVMNVTYGGTSEEETTDSNVTVNVFVEISLSTNLSTGILFGSLDPNTNNNNATGNYNATDFNTQYEVVAGSANSVSIDLCIKANDTLSTGSEDIPNTGYTWNFSEWNNMTNPDEETSIAITTDYQTTSHTEIAASGKSYARFFLDIPAAQAAGVYRNTITIKGVQTGEAC